MQLSALAAAALAASLLLALVAARAAALAPAACEWAGGGALAACGAAACAPPPPPGAALLAAAGGALALALAAASRPWAAARRRRGGGGSARPRADRAALLARVAPSKHGFLPATVPRFDFGSELDKFISDAVAPVYAAGDAAAFRRWLEGRLDAEVDAAAVAAAVARLDGAGQRAALVPLVFLAHAHRWGATDPPAWVLADAAWAPPPALGAPLGALCRELGLQRTGSVTQLFLNNWALAGRPPGSEYDPRELTTANLAPRFRFCAGGLAAAEAAVLQSVVLTEAASTATHMAALALFEAAADAEAGGGGAAAAAAAAAAADVEAGLRACLATFHGVFRQSNLSTHAWAVHLQPFYCALSPGEHGVGGAQIPWVHATDAAFGIDQSADALGGVVAANRRCLLAEERLFVAYLEAHALAARRWLGRAPEAEPARRHWNGALRALIAWRATHRARAAAYLVPGAAPGAAPRATTGGTAGYGKEGGGAAGGEGGGAPDAAAGGEGGGAPDAAAAIVAGFNAMMDGRIAQTRAAAVADAGAAPSGGGGMAALFPEAAA
ncbi:MAG: hypothetical protein J3K34DRAFT_519049 [Monoraphidium minutum]|nr:MAG: hypothetical protein J3K34DRAFT_519049 [Monoraphidium minutum]